MVCGTPGHFRLHTLEAKLAQFQLIDEYVNDPHRVIFGDIVVQMLGEQGALRTILAFDKSLHRALPLLQRGSLNVSRIINVYTATYADALENIYRRNLWFGVWSIVASVLLARTHVKDGPL